MTPFLAPRPLPPEQLRRSWGQRMLLTFNVLLIAATLAIAAGFAYGGQRAAAVNRVALDRSLSERPEAVPGSRVLNVLLVGSDSSANLDPDDPVQVGRHGEKLGDVIIIVHIDERTRSLTMLSLPRDLWVDVADSNRQSRINRTYSLGGAAMLINTIEENFDIPIHHFVNVDFASFEGLVEALGGVDVYFDTPARDWNVNAKPQPRSQTGFLVETAGCHRLSPRQALSYVRSRYYQTMTEDGRWVTDPTADLGRIRRQQGFLKSLMQQAVRQGARNPLVLADVVDVAIQNVQIDQDLTAAEILDLATSYSTFEPSELETYTFPAIDDTIRGNRVLVPQHERAGPLVALFNGAPQNSPTSVSVMVRTAPDSGAQGRRVAAELRGAGYLVETDTVNGVAPGVEIAHGGSEGALAEMAASVLGDHEPTIVDGTPGAPRTLVVSVGPENTGTPDDPEGQLAPEPGATSGATPDTAARGEVAQEGTGVGDTPGTTAVGTVGSEPEILARGQC